MSRQLEIFDDVSEQTSFAQNPGERDGMRGSRIGRLSVSPAMERAKVARPPKDSAAPPQAVAAPSQPPPHDVPSEPQLLRDMAGIVEALKRACDERGITYETLNEIAGVADNYVSKLFAHKPMKNLGYQSTGKLLRGVGKALILVDDPEMIARVKDRWTPRKRPGTHRPLVGALLDDSNSPSVPSTLEDKHGETTPELPPEGGTGGGD